MTPQYKELAYKEDECTDKKRHRQLVIYDQFCIFLPGT